VFTGTAVWAAIRGWPETIRLCLIIVVVAATTVCVYLTKTSGLPLFMK
jgi:hypothetical protein